MYPISINKIDKQDLKIYFFGSDNENYIFDIKEILNDLNIVDREKVINDFENVEIDFEGFIWRDKVLAREVYIDSDTIERYSIKYSENQ